MPKKRRGGGWSDIFLKFSKSGVKINGGRGGGGNFKKSFNIGHEWKKIYKCLILMLNFKISKQTRSEASKTKVIIKRISNISIN